MDRQNEQLPSEHSSSRWNYHLSMMDRFEGKNEEKYNHHKAMAEKYKRAWELLRKEGL